MCVGLSWEGDTLEMCCCLDIYLHMSVQPILLWSVLLKVSDCDLSCYLLAWGTFYPAWWRMLHSEARDILKGIK